MTLREVTLFALRRLDRRSFTGLPLTLLTAAGGYLLAEFLDLTEDVAEASSPSRADRLAEEILTRLRAPALLRAFFLATQLGNWRFVLLAALGASVVWLGRGRRFLVLPLWAACLGSLAFNWSAKAALGRPRPLDAYYLEPSFAYPSGHSAIAVACYGFLAYAVWKTAPSARLRRAAPAGGMALIGLIGFSRLYLGVHYLSDVAGGFMQGGVCLTVGVGLAEWLEARQKQQAAGRG